MVERVVAFPSQPMPAPAPEPVEVDLALPVGERLSKATRAELAASAAWLERRAADCLAKAERVRAHLASKEPAPIRKRPTKRQ